MKFRPDRDGVLREYKFAVALETEEQRRPPVSKGKRASYREYYHQAQIIIVETTGGGIPAEVGTWMKPGKVDCAVKICETLQEAINVSYAVADGTYEEGAQKVSRRPKKRQKKFRHKA